MAQEPLGVRPVFVRSTWTQIVLAVARTTSKYVCSFARRMVPTGMTGAVGVEVDIGISSCYWCCLPWIVVLVYHVSAPRVRLVAATDTFPYCLSGDVAQEC